MGDPLKKLEERLEQLVPQGLSESGRTRLEEQIDELAAQVGPAARSRRPWPRLAGIAAMVAVVAALGALIKMKETGEGSVTTPGEASIPEVAEGSGIEMVEFQREVGEDWRDGGIVLTRFNEPMRSWSYDVREVELVLDKESGLEVRIVSERREAVLTAVTSF